MSETVRVGWELAKTERGVGKEEERNAFAKSMEAASKTSRRVVRLRKLSRLTDCVP